MDMYVDTADLREIEWALSDAGANGVTTNPTLMRRAGVTDYVGHARDIVSLSGSLPVSLEVIADEPREMLRQARWLSVLSGVRGTVYVKIPVVNSRGESCLDVVRELVSDGHLVNVTAILTRKQYRETVGVVSGGPHIVSVFAGRIADTGRSPMTEIMQMSNMAERGEAKLLWASVREVYNVEQANMVNCDVITLPPELIRKRVAMNGKDLHCLSVETATMFYRDAVAAGYVL